MRRPLSPVLLVLLLAAALQPAGCTRFRQAPSAGGAVPADLQVTFGSGGGFTGRWQGHTIRADGTVLAWEGALPGEGPRPAGRLTPAQVDSLWRHIEAADFFSRPTRGSGNLTGFIALVARADTHTVRWPVEGSAAGVVHGEPLYGVLQGFARRAVPGR